MCTDVLEQVSNVRVIRMPASNVHAIHAIPFTPSAAPRGDHLGCLACCNPCTLFGEVIKKTTLLMLDLNLTPACVVCRLFVLTAPLLQCA